MSLAVRLLALAACVLPFAASAQAQDASPKITIVSAGADALTQDMSFMLGLTSEKEQEQLEIVLDYLSVFQLGIDTEKPIRFDLIVRDTAVAQRPSFPIADLGDFLENLDGFGITYKRKGSSRYELGDAFEGHMIVQKRTGFVAIAEDRQDLPTSLNSTDGLLELLEPGFDVVADMTNEDEGIDERRKAFEAVRSELMAAVKPLENEKKEDFDARKVLTEQQINELERFFVEAKHLNAGWTTDQENKNGSAALTLNAIPETDLAKSFELLGKDPSYFSGVARSEDPVLGLSINHPLDQFRRDQTVAAMAVLKERALAHIDTAEKLDDDQKAATKTINEQFFDMVTAGVKEGMFDIFADLQKGEDGKYKLIGGFRSPASANMVEILKALPGAKVASKVETDIEKVGDASIHKVHVLEDDKIFTEEFGEDRVVLVATTPEAVWYAAGEGALDSLKAALETEPTEEGVEKFFHIKMRLGPFVELRERVAAEEESDDDEDGKFRAMATEAFKAGDDRFEASLSRKDADITGVMSVETGIMRMVGKLIADFSKENLEE